MSLFVGGVPLVIWHTNNPDSSIAAGLVYLNPGDPIVLYLASMTIVNFIVWLINRYWFMPSYSLRENLNKTHLITHQIGFSILSIYRAVAGAIPAAYFIVLYKTKDTSGAIPVGLVSLALFAGAIFMCCLLTSLESRTRPRS